MQIVLLERIAKLGQMGDVVNVKDGYARNYLLPQGKALRANKANLDALSESQKELAVSHHVQIVICLAVVKDGLQAGSANSAW